MERFYKLIFTMSIFYIDLLPCKGDTYMLNV